MDKGFPTNHNYYAESPIVDSKILKEKLGVKGRAKPDSYFPLSPQAYELTTKSANIKQLPIFRFKPEKDKTDDDEQLILKLYKTGQGNGTQYFVQTGLFAGVVYYQGCEFNISCAYGDVFLNRMLNFLNGIYIDSQPTTATDNPKSNVFLHIIAYLFVQSLEKSAQLGLPKRYQQQTQRSYKVRGSVDINAYLRDDIPFQGKLTTRFREQVYAQEIIDVLFAACEQLKSVLGTNCLKPIFNIYQMLKAEHSRQFVNQNMINTAKNSAVLHNPMFIGFKTVLEYAEIIINNVSLEKSTKGNNETHGYLFDISQLFELYLEKLLAHHFPDWEVCPQEQLQLYLQRFYHRNMYPDIVMKHKFSNKVIVFDAKFKKMSFGYQDLDRNDFYQIHTYMQYYGSDLLFGGLLYPLSAELNSQRSHSEFLFDTLADTAPFIVDGIELGKSSTDIEQIVASEHAFIHRIQKMIDSRLAK